MHFCSTAFKYSYHIPVPAQTGLVKPYFDAIVQALNNVGALGTNTVIVVTFLSVSFFYLQLFRRNHLTQEKRNKIILTTILKCTNSFVITFFMPLLIELKGLAILNFLIAVTKINIKALNDLIIEKYFPDDYTQLPNNDVEVPNGNEES